MAMKFVIFLAICCALAAISEARHVAGHRERSHISGQRVQPQHRAIAPKPHATQTRVFPGAVAIKKLVLLKFKKIVPISLILLKSSNDNEAELVPLYSTDQIPEDVQFIPTPNGISGHKDVQAIAIPSELHDQLQINGLSNLENIEALLQNSAIASADGDDSADGAASVGNSIAVAQPEDAPLVKPDNDEDQLLEGSSVAEQPAANALLTGAAVPGLRRLAVNNELLRSGLRGSLPQQTNVEEIPLVLYSQPEIAPNGRISGRRFVAATPARQHQKFY